MINKMIFAVVSVFITLTHICSAISFRQNNFITTATAPDLTFQRNFDFLVPSSFDNLLGNSLDPFEEYFAGDRVVKQYRVVEEENHGDDYHYHVLLANQLQQLIAPLLTEKHGPVALGSGSLGVVQAHGGNVFLGSGSLGYISHQQHADGLGTILGRRLQISRPGPLSFGHRFE